MHENTILNRLPGAANVKARKLYHALKSHLQDATCPMCSFYKQYGVMIVKGDFFEHLQDIHGGKFALADIFKLKDAKIIGLDEISARQYRVTIYELAPKEITA